MQFFPAALQDLADHFARLPGIGGKTAQRLAFHVLELPLEDAQAFADWYLALSALTGAGTLPADYTPEGEAIGEIVLTNETMTRTITFYAYDALHAAMGVDGTYLYYIEKDFFQSIAPAP